MNQNCDIKELYDTLHTCMIAEMPERPPETFWQMIKTAELDKNNFYTNMPKAIPMNEEGTGYLIRNLVDGYIMGPDNVDGTNSFNVLAFSIFFDSIYTVPLDLWFPVWLPNKLEFSSEPLVTQVPVMKTEDGVTKIKISDSTQFLDSKLLDVKPKNDRVIMDLYTYKFLQGVKDYHMVIPVSRQHSISAMKIDNFPVEDQTKRWILLDILHRHIKSSVEDKKAFLKRELVKKRVEKTLKDSLKVFNEIPVTATPMDYQMESQKDRIIIEEID